MIGIIVGSVKLESEQQFLIDLVRNNETYIIVADGGISFFMDKCDSPDMPSIIPDMWIGDMDSSSYEVAEVKRIYSNLIIETCSPIKDETDMAIAVRILKDKSCKDIYIFGGLGGKRPDHSIANIQLLHGYALENINIKMIGPNTLMQVLVSRHNQEKSIEFSKDNKGFVSIFSLTDVCENVDIKDLFYEYQGELRNNNALGVSNEFIGKEAKITLMNGSLLIVNQINN